LTESLDQEIKALLSLHGSPRDPEGRSFAPLADAYRRAGDFRRALELLREGLERHPGFVPGHIVASRLYLETGLLEEAEISARRAVELDEENTMAWGLLAGALEARGALAQARDARARLAELESVGAAEEPQPEPVLEMADLAPEETGGSPEAEAVLDIAELAPDEAEAEAEPVVDVAALAPEETGAPPEAEAVLDIAELAPDEAEAVVDVAALAPEGEPAAEDLPSDELPEGEPLVTRTIAELYARQGLTERALDVYRQLLQLTPGDPELRRRVAELEGTAGAETPEPEEEAPEMDHAWTTAAAEKAHDVETPFAWTAPAEPEDAPPPGPSAASYFGRMLAWEPGAERSGEDPSPSVGDV